MKNHWRRHKRLKYPVTRWPHHTMKPMCWFQPVGASPISTSPVYSPAFQWLSRIFIGWNWPARRTLIGGRREDVQQGGGRLAWVQQRDAGAALGQQLWQPWLSLQARFASRYASTTHQIHFIWVKHLPPPTVRRKWGLYCFADFFALIHFLGFIGYNAARFLCLHTADFLFLPHTSQICLIWAQKIWKVKTDSTCHLNMIYKRKKVISKFNWVFICKISQSLPTAIKIVNIIN